MRTRVRRASKTKRVYDTTLKREFEQQVWESAVIFSARPQLAGPLHIPEGFVQSFRFKILIPPGAKPSLKSMDRVVAWNLKGVIAVEGRPDATSENIEIQVSQPSQVQQAPLTASCKYCGTVFPQGETRCPNCGAPRTAQ